MNSEASGERIGSSNIFSRKREASSVSTPSDGANKRSMHMNLDILDCPICYQVLRIPIFQCCNGHIACPSCFPKLRNKCPQCALPLGYSRCRAMESVLESISITCPNAEYGCTTKVSYGIESTHEKECVFSQCKCPELNCDYTDSYDNLYLHYMFAHSELYRFNFNVSFTTVLNINDKISIIMDEKKELLFAVQCFKEPYGVYVTVSCIAPSAPEVGKYSYFLSYFVDGHTMLYRSPEMKRVLEVSIQTPPENFMLIPNSLLRGEMLEIRICVMKLKQE